MGLLLLILVNVLALGVRMLITGTPTYLFLIWNLFLALIPLGLSTWAIRREWKGAERVKLVGLALGWLFFLPNAPYLLTDFYHLIWKEKTDMIWFDIGMLFLYSFTAILAFYASLNQAELLWKKYLKRGATAFVVVVSLLCAYAIYLGRYIRLNTWDLVLHPWSVLQEMWLALQTQTFWDILLSFFFFIMLGYVLFRNRRALAKDLQF